MDLVPEASLYRPRPSDLIAFLPFACQQLEAQFHVRILVETVEEHVDKSAADDRSKKSKRDKVTPQTQTSASHYSDDKEASVAAPDYGDATYVVLRVRCDALGRPVELVFLRCPRVPRLLLKIIGLCIPYHEQLTKISVRWAPLDGAVLYEIAKFLPLSQVTEIRLDDSPVSHRNYHVLLEQPTQVRILSLARCGLADEDCVALAARLTPPLPASRTLACLSLESNRIGDEGARALGEALRTNRSLRHLNLAGNAITSVGASHVFRSLAQFRVSIDEIILKRQRTFEYLKLRRDAYARCYRELMQSSEQESIGGRGRTRVTGTRMLTAARGRGGEALGERADAMAAELVGARADPFDQAELVTRSDATCCVGNFSLSYLNLAYNDLDCTSVGRLAEVLAYQMQVEQCSGPGLLRVVLEGNALPAACDAAHRAENLLERTLGGVATFPPPAIRPGRKSERPKFK